MRIRRTYDQRAAERFRRKVDEIIAEIKARPKSVTVACRPLNSADMERYEREWAASGAIEMLR